ncbi:MAG: hypothetical protein ACYTEZ_07005 [Planctomycetota bacterium]|jgi:hypothetical protein
MRRLAPLLACLLAAGSARAEEKISLAQYLPARTPVLLEIQTPSPEELKQLCMSRMLQDPRLQELLRRVAGEDSSIASARIPLGRAGLVVCSNMADPALSVDVRYVDPKGERAFRIRNRVSVAWVGLAEGEFPVDLVAAVQVDTDPRDAVATIQRIAAAASLMVRGVKDGDVDAELKRLIKHESYRDVGYAWAQLGPVKLCLAPVGRLVVLTTGEARIRDILDRHLDGSADSLAADPRHQAMLRHAAGTGTASTTIEVHVDRALEAIRALHPQAAGQMAGSLQYVGLGGLQSVTHVARVDGEGISSTTSFNIADTSRGLGRLFAPGKPASYGCLTFAPKETMYVNCGNFDAAGLLDMITEVGGMGAALAQARFEGMLGLRLREDLLDLLGPEAALIVAPNRGLIPDLAVVFESTDAARLEKSLLQVLEAAEWPAGTGVKTFRLGGIRVHTMPLGHKKLAEIPIAPTFGVVDGRLLVTLYPLSFQRFLSVKQGSRPGLETNRDFARLRDRVPEDAQGMSYLDLKRVFELIYETAIPLLQSIPGQVGPSPLYEFPEVEVFTQHLFGRVAWRTADDGGLRWQSYSSLDTSGFLLGSLAAGAGVYYATSRHVAQRKGPERHPPPRGAVVRDRESQTCKYRVRLLRARIRLYQQEHRRLPDSLDQLRAEHVAPETFLVPGTDRKPYVYLGPDGQGEVLLHGLANGADRHICVLTRKLEVERVSAAELQRLLGR